MREIPVSQISETVADLCVTANQYLPPDVLSALTAAAGQETSSRGREILELLVENTRIAASEELPICQDTGMAVVFVELGQEVHIIGGSLTEAINAGVREGYRRGYLRNSVVSDPLERKNTRDNTPAVIHLDLVPGDALRITVLPKGFGSENMSRLTMLKPSDGIEGVKQFVVEAVRLAGGNPCPPIIVGVGIGGTMEKAAILAKTALLRPLPQPHPKESIRALEAELLAAINGTGVGPQGLGGVVTALGVKVEIYPTHIAGLPVAVNLSCHASRHAAAVI